jgi:hypothetical protein
MVEGLVWAPVVTRPRWLQICGMPSEKNTQRDDKLELKEKVKLSLCLTN